MLLLTLLLAVFSLNATAASRRTVERGMTKQQVTDILGKPKAASFDQAGTRWEYINQDDPVISTALRVFRNHAAFPKKPQPKPARGKVAMVQGCPQFHLQRNLTAHA